MIIGREKEIALLTEFANSNRPEFVAVYGRRRVGKTFLIRNAFRDKFARKRFCGQSVNRPADTFSQKKRLTF